MAAEYSDRSDEFVLGFRAVDRTVHKSSDRPGDVGVCKLGSIHKVSFD